MSAVVGLASTGSPKSEPSVNGTHWRTEPPRDEAGPSNEQTPVESRWETSLDIARAAWLGVAPLAPLFAAALAVALYAGPLRLGPYTSTGPSVIGGVIDLLFAWALLACAYAALGLTRVDRANTSTFCELRNVLTELLAMRDAVLDAGSRHVGDAQRLVWSTQHDSACRQFDGYTRPVAQVLEHNGRGWTRAVWVLGTGYVSAWQLVHRAQQVLVSVEPHATVMQRAQYDLQRLAGSSIENQALLSERLGQAIGILSPYAADQNDLAALSELERAFHATADNLRAWQPSASKAEAEKLGAQVLRTAQMLSAAPLTIGQKAALFTDLNTAAQQIITPEQGYWVAGAIRAAARDASQAAIEYIRTSWVANDQRTKLLLAELERTCSQLDRWRDPCDLTTRDALIEQLLHCENQVQTVDQAASQMADLVTSLSAVRRCLQDSVDMYAFSAAAALADKLDQFVPTLLQTPGSNGLVAAGTPTLGTLSAVAPPTSTNQFGVPPAPRNATEARMLVAMIRETLNEHRDRAREGLVRARNRLSLTTVSTAVIAYVVLWLALAARASMANIQAGLAYFLVGALVGLFSRMYTEFGSDTATDDFGLSSMRVLAAPQLSGIAAVVGVGLLALADNAMQGSASGGIGRAFDLSAGPVNLVVAAVFGLTPGLLIDRLKQQTDNLRGNLRKTEAQDSSSSPSS